MSRHNLLSYGTTYFLTAQLTFSRHNLLSHDTTYFLHGTIYFLTTQLTFFTAQLTFSRHNLLSHGTTYFLTAKVIFLLQKLLFYWSRHNLLSQSTTYFLTAEVNFRGGRAGNQSKKTQYPLGRVPRQNRFRFPSWLLIVTMTMKMWCKYELFIFSLSYSNILKGLLLV